jgi:hypothetical protein
VLDDRHELLLADRRVLLRVGDAGERGRAALGRGGWLAGCQAELLRLVKRLHEPLLAVFG